MTLISETEKATLLTIRETEVSEFERMRDLFFNRSPEQLHNNQTKIPTSSPRPLSLEVAIGRDKTSSVPQSMEVAIAEKKNKPSPCTPANRETDLRFSMLLQNASGRLIQLTDLQHAAKTRGPADNFAPLQNSSCSCNRSSDTIHKNGIRGDEYPQAHLKFPYTGFESVVEEAEPAAKLQTDLGGNDVMGGRRQLSVAKVVQISPLLKGCLVLACRAGIGAIASIRFFSSSGVISSQLRCLSRRGGCPCAGRC